MNRVPLFAVCVWLLANAAHAGYGLGKSAGNLLKLEMSARTAAMGGAFSAVADDASAAAWNPSGLPQLDGPELSLMHLQWFDNITFDSLIYAWPSLGGSMAAGLSLRNSPAVDNTGPLNLGNMGVETAHAMDFQGLLAYAFEFDPRFSAGAGLKVFRLDLSGSTAFGYSLDLGFLAQPLGRFLAFSLLLQNAGGSLRFESADEILPLTLRLGAAWRVYQSDDNVANFAIEALRPVDNRFKFSLGGELWWHQLLAFRAGYKLTEAGQDFGPFSLANLTLGSGWKGKAARIDYAFEPYDELGQAHRISAGYSFGGKAVPTPEEQILFFSPRILLSDRVPYLDALIQFRPREKIADLKRWTASVLDLQGRILKTFSDSAPMPKDLVWNRALKDKRLKMGDPLKYSLKLVAKDGTIRLVSGDLNWDLDAPEKTPLPRQPFFDSALGGLVFELNDLQELNPKSWTFQVTSRDGEILGHSQDLAPLPRALVWVPSSRVGRVLEYADHGPGLEPQDLVWAPVDEEGNVYKPLSSTTLNLHPKELRWVPYLSQADLSRALSSTNAFPEVLQWDPLSRIGELQWNLLKPVEPSADLWHKTGLKVLAARQLIPKEFLWSLPEGEALLARELQGIAFAPVPKALRWIPMNSQDLLLKAMPQAASPTPKEFRWHAAERDGVELKVESDSQAIPRDLIWVPSDEDWKVLKNLPAMDTEVRRPSWKPASQDEPYWAARKNEIFPLSYALQLKDKDGLLRTFKGPVNFAAPPRALPESLKLKSNENATIVSLVISADVLFHSGRAEIRPDAQAVLEEAAAKIESVMSRVLHVQVVGNTDNVRIRYSPFADNQALSEARAESVKRFLLERLKLDPAIFVSEGRADKEPVAGNDSAQGRQKNRRVDIILKIAGIRRQHP